MASLDQWLEGAGDRPSDRLRHLGTETEERSPLGGLDRPGDVLLELRVEADHAETTVGTDVLTTDRAPEGVADVLGEHLRILGLPAPIGESLEDRLEVANRHLLAQERLKDLLDLVKKVISNTFFNYILKNNLTSRITTRLTSPTLRKRS